VFVSPEGTKTEKIRAVWDLNGPAVDTEATISAPGCINWLKEVPSDSDLFSMIDVSPYFAPDDSFLQAFAEGLDVTLALFTPAPLADGSSESTEISVAATNVP